MMSSSSEASRVSPIHILQTFLSAASRNIGVTAYASGYFGFSEKTSKPVVMPLPPSRLFAAVWLMNGSNGCWGSALGPTTHVNARHGSLRPQMPLRLPLLLLPPGRTYEPFGQNHATPAFLVG